MASLKPGLSSYARVSYARELLGDFRGAAQAMRLAVDAAVGQPEAVAWSQTQLGKLLWSQGRAAAAEHEYRSALAIRPGYVYALDGLAQVEAARGHLRRAVSYERRAVETMPLPQFVAALGDLEHLAGNETAARRQYALIGAIHKLLSANGVRTDLETAAFDVDHAVRLPKALSLAKAAHHERPSIDGDDVLAWALARNGRCTDALHYSKRALRLGTLDATKFFHRGMVERCLGHEADAKTWFRRALSLNPHFSLLWAPGRKEVRGMKRLVLLSLALAALALPATASAHPLGNFTVNRFSRIEVAGPRVYVLYVLDLAEIPTFQAGKIDAQLYARRIARGAHLTVNGRRVRSDPCGDCPRASCRRGRAEDDTVRGGAPRSGAHGSQRNRLPRHELRQPHRLEGGARRYGAKPRATSYVCIRRTSSRVR